MEIKSLSKVDFDTISRAFNQAFANYEVQINKAQLQSMLKRRGFNPDLSFAAFDNNEIVAFTLNGTGNYNGMTTAYDTGTGTLKEYRGQGLATRIFEYSIPWLRQANIKQYLLEVLQHNTKAVSVYTNLGFEVTREFYYSTQENERINNEVKNPGQYMIKQVGIEELDSAPDFWDFYPSWQNSFESIHRAINDFVILGALVDDKLAGYCVFEPASGDITQLAVDRQNRRKGIATTLLNEAVKLNKNNTVKVVNTDIECGSVNGFLKAKNIDIKGKQFEMIRKI